MQLTKFKWIFSAIFAVGVFVLTAAIAGQSHSPLDPKIIMVEGREAEPVLVKSAQGDFHFTAEIANTPEKSAKGLMFRESMPPRHGMLFDFGQMRPIMMWMKNTPLSLDMIFLSSDGKVSHIAERTTPFSEAIISSQSDAYAVFEVNAGISRLIGLKIGDRIEHRMFNNVFENDKAAEN